MDSKQKTAAELRDKLLSESSTAREIISSLFDTGTFVELGAYVKRALTEYDSEKSNGDFEGVITGYGAVNGQLIYAFVQDYSRMKGALSGACAKKIVTLYELAMKNNAPIIGVFDSAGTFVTEGISALAGYGSVMKAAANASCVIPQIALITGVCSGAAAIIANMFDFKIGIVDKGEFYINPPFIIKERFKDLNAGTMKSAASNGVIDIAAENFDEAVNSLKNLLNYLPSDYQSGTVIDSSEDNLNRLTPEIKDIVNGKNYDMIDVVKTITDNGKYIELLKDNAKEIFTGFIKLNGMVVGICANQPLHNNGLLTAKAAVKAEKLINFCDSFDIPLLTLVDTEGFDISLESENTPYSYALANLAAAYSLSDSAKVTVILGKAYGSAYTLLGSKSLGTDIAYAVDTAEISIMNPESAVQFAWNDEITASEDPVLKKAELTAKWKETMASPLVTARNGDVDDIIAFEEARQRIISAFEMLAFKNGG